MLPGKVDKIWVKLGKGRFSGAIGVNIHKSGLAEFRLQILLHILGQRGGGKTMQFTYFYLLLRNKC